MLKSGHDTSCSDAARAYFLFQSSVTFLTRSLQGSFTSVKCSVSFDRLKW